MELKSPLMDISRNEKQKREGKLIPSFKCLFSFLSFVFPIYLSVVAIRAKLPTYFEISVLGFAFVIKPDVLICVATCTL